MEKRVADQKNPNNPVGFLVTQITQMNPIVIMIVIVI